MIALLKIATVLLTDALRLVLVSMRSHRALAAENLFLRRQLALYEERGQKVRRVDVATRVSLAWLSRQCDWRSALAYFTGSVRVDPLFAPKEDALRASGAYGTFEPSARTAWHTHPAGQLLIVTAIV